MFICNTIVTPTSLEMLLTWSYPCVSCVMEMFFCVCVAVSRNLLVPTSQLSCLLSAWIFWLGCCLLHASLSDVLCLISLQLCFLMREAGALAETKHGAANGEHGNVKWFSCFKYFLGTKLTLIGVTKFLSGVTRGQFTVHWGKCLGGGGADTVLHCLAAGTLIIVPPGSWLRRIL